MKLYEQPALYVDVLESKRVLNALTLNGTSGEIDTEVGVGGEEE